MTATLNREKEVVSLPDYSSLEETTAFVAYLKDNIDRYGVKKLLYHTEMIEGHLRRIHNHAVCAEKILVRVNGDITEVQKQFYSARAAKTIARKFYSSLSDSALEHALEVRGIEYSVYEGGVERVEKLVKNHVERYIKV